MSVSNFLALYDAIPRRHSVRAFDGRKLSEEHMRAICAACELSPPFFSGARVIPVFESAEKVFPGVVIRGAPAFLAMVGETSAPHVNEALGYLGENAVLQATAIGLSTCWVSGTFRPSETRQILSLAADERIYAVSPLGYGTRAGIVGKVFSAVARSSTRKPLDELVTSESLVPSECPPWARSALDAARLAPSAANRQPWRFTVKDDRIKVSLDTGDRDSRISSKRLDCGITMFHIEVAAMSAGVPGSWTLLDTPDVAEYVVH